MHAAYAVSAPNVPHRQASPNALRKRQIQPYPLPGIECLALNKVQWPLQADDAVLLVHDMQNFWLDFFVDAQPVLAAVHSLVVSARESGVPIVYTRGERPRHVAERALGVDMWGAGLAGEGITDHDIAICETLAPRPQDFVIDKLRVSAFYETPLAGLLGKMGRRQLVVCGVFAHHGVMVSSIEAFMRNHKVQLVADALGDYSEDDHWMALRYVAQTCGHLVLSEQVRKAFSSDRSSS
jgi:bifunctional isochorismate lyase / aryl carrier protein